MSDRVNNTGLIVSLTSATAEDMRADVVAAAAGGADMAELRLDYLADAGPAALKMLLPDSPLPLIATCRPARQGGKFTRGEDERLAILAKAGELGADYIDIEDDVDRAHWPAGRIILSHHDFTARPADLGEIVARLDASDADVIKVAFASAGPEDALAALDVLRSASKPAISLAMGAHGVASRILARKFGAFGTFASLRGGAESAPGQLTVAEMRSLYRWEHISAATAVYGVIGCPVGHSMSPAIHNAAFADAGIDAVYVPLLIDPGAENFDLFFDALAEAPWVDLGGVSVTIPHKENALARVGAANADELSRQIGAINTIKISPDATMVGANSDYAAAIDALVEAMGIAREVLAGRTVAVIGAGGAARAIVAALAHYGAKVTIYNRTLVRAQRLAEEFAASARPLEAIGELVAEIIINCTSVGMYPNVDTAPAPVEALSGVKVVFDTIYNPPETRLLREAAEAGCACVTGVDMFVNQAVTQFEIWTGQPAPRQLMCQVVLESLKA